MNGQNMEGFGDNTFLITSQDLFGVAKGHHENFN
jgi:hypothetical protein